MPRTGLSQGPFRSENRGAIPEAAILILCGIYARVMMLTDPTGCHISFSTYWYPKVWYADLQMERVVIALWDHGFRQPDGRKFLWRCEPTAVELGYNSAGGVEELLRDRFEEIAFTSDLCRPPARRLQPVKS